MTYFKPSLRGATSMLAMALVATSVTTAHAQVEAEEFIITARKKEESLLDTPIAVTAFNEVQLQEAGFVDIIDISKATPGLFIEDFNDTPARINTTPRFRGVFFSTGNRLQQTATIFLDGVYMSDGAETLGINELQRVEIIKGPQSALFGRNTFAGAINYVTKDPGDELRADINTTIASRGEYRVAGGVEGPIMEGLNFRLGGMFESNNGHYDNVTVPGQRLGDEQQWSINGTLFWEPTDRFRTKLRASYRKVDDGAPAAQETAGVVFHNFGGFAENPDGTIDMSDSIIPTRADVAAGIRTESVFQGTIRQPDESTIGMNSSFADIMQFRDAVTGDGRFNAPIANQLFKYNFLNQDEFGLKLDSFRVGINSNFDITDNIDFTLLGGYNKENFGRWIDFDLTGDLSFGAYSSREIEDYTIEGRLAGSFMDDRLYVQAGASYVDIEILSSNGTANFFGPTIVFGDIFNTVPFRTQAKTLGFFGTVDYQITDQISITLEGRYQEDEVAEDEVNGPLIAAGFDAISPATFSNFLPRATLRYEPNDDMTFYLTYSEGNLPGGFNPEVAEIDDAQLAELRQLAPDASTTFGEEKLENFEFGWKQQLLDGRAGFNLAAFYMKRSDEIVRQILGITETDPTQPNDVRTVAFNSNGATTNIYGVELDWRFQVTDNLNLTGSAAYIDAKIDSFPEGAGTGDFGDIFGLAADVAGQQAPRFPPFSASIAGAWEQDIEGGLLMFDGWFVRGDVFYTGNFYDSNANTTEVQDAFDSNVRFGLSSDNVRLEFFVTNVFGESAPAAAFNFSDLTVANRTRPGGFFDFSREGAQVALRDKRQFGLRFNYTFQ